MGPVLLHYRSIELGLMPAIQKTRVVEVAGQTWVVSYAYAHRQKLSFGFHQLLPVVRKNLTLRLEFKLLQLQSKLGSRTGENISFLFFKNFR